MDLVIPDRICNTRMEMLRCHPAGRVLAVLIDEDRGRKQKRMKTAILLLCAPVRGAATAACGES